MRTTFSNTTLRNASVKQLLDMEKSIINEIEEIKKIDEKADTTALEVDYCWIMKTAMEKMNENLNAFFAKNPNKVN